MPTFSQKEEEKGRETMPITPIAHTVGALQLSERSTQLMHALQRALETNRRLELELAAQDTQNRESAAEIVRLQQQIEQARALGALKTPFLAMASHEFRTAMTTISSSATLARQYAAVGNANKEAHHLEKIRVEVAHLSEILHDFLQAAQYKENRDE